MESMNSPLRALRVVAQVQQPLLLGELGDPDDVGLQHVAVGRLGLGALDELVADRGRVRRQLEYLDLQPVGGVLLVEQLDRLGQRAAGVLAGAHRHLALGALRRVERRGLLRALGRALVGARRASAAPVVAAARERERRQRRAGKVPDTELAVHVPPPDPPLPARAPCPGRRRVNRGGRCARAAAPCAGRRRRARRAGGWSRRSSGAARPAPCAPSPTTRPGPAAP